MFCARHFFVVKYPRQKTGDQNHAALTSQTLRAAIGPLQFSLRHWNLRNLTLHSGILPYKKSSRFFRPAQYFRTAL